MATIPENQPEAQGVMTHRRSDAQQGVSASAQGKADAGSTVQGTALTQPTIT